MFNLIKKDRYFIFTFISLFCAIGWFLNFSLWHIPVFYFLFSIFYFLINSIWLGQILGRAIDLERELQFIFGLFLMLFLIGFGLAIPTFADLFVDCIDTFNCNYFFFKSPNSPVL